MLQLVAVGTAAFLMVFFKSFQQRNVAYDNLAAIIPTSFALATTEFFVISTIALMGMNPFAVICYALGAGVGSLCATILHKKYMTKGKKLG